MRKELETVDHPAIIRFVFNKAAKWGAVIGDEGCWALCADMRRICKVDLAAALHYLCRYAWRYLALRPDPTIEEKQVFFVSNHSTGISILLYSTIYIIYPDK